MSSASPSLVMAMARVINRRNHGRNRMFRNPSITIWPASVPVITPLALSAPYRSLRTLASWRPSMRQVVVVMPSAFTLGNLFFGFWAIVSAFNGNFRWAGWFIVFAGILDMLDGRVARLMKATSLPVGLKGIMTASDARRAVETGVRLIWVSNHGGRQLDQTQSSIDALPAIVDAVGDAAEIVIDGGISRGTDVVKALARGARVVAVGRTALWGLAADGAAGVARTFEILREEVRTTMGLCGRTKLADLTPDLISRAD